MKISWRFTVDHVYCIRRQEYSASSERMRDSEHQQKDVKSGAANFGACRDFHLIDNLDSERPEEHREHPQEVKLQTA